MYRCSCHGFLVAAKSGHVCFVEPSSLIPITMLQCYCVVTVKGVLITGIQTVVDGAFRQEKTEATV